jgi:hypothetical protein
MLSEAAVGLARFAFRTSIHADQLKKANPPVGLWQVCLYIIGGQQATLFNACQIARRGKGHQIQVSPIC